MTIPIANRTDGWPRAFSCFRRRGGWKLAARPLAAGVVDYPLSKPREPDDRPEAVSLAIVARGALRRRYSRFEGIARDR